jgi:general L-amino acid transport system permease protein
METAAMETFVRRELIAPLPPPLATSGMLGFLRRRLFGSVFNIVLTLLSLLLVIVVLPPLVRFLIIDAVWSGTSRTDCLAETLGRPVGACWPFVAAKFRQFMYGFYPEAEQWRVNLTYALGVILLVPLLIPRVPYKAWNAIAFFGLFPLVAFVLLVGGVLGLPHVETRLWGGMLVTLVITFTGIIGSYRSAAACARARVKLCPSCMRSRPFSSGSGAAYRWSRSPLRPTCCRCFCRATGGMDPVQVLIGIVLFAGAYMAEVVRWPAGGARGQYEARPRSGSATGG